jgi:hypothetical protein
MNRFYLMQGHYKMKKYLKKKKKLHVDKETSPKKLSDSINESFSFMREDFQKKLEKNKVS